ncbi:MAG TPA: PaaX family transcriptional regulator C-terminal domain-containing protein [Longimicrobiales bacterium]|nr:PaaX family transcriptional regulator C-terminal domain-containing protein [Longimicrobiales bacterium]
MSTTQRPQDLVFTLFGEYLLHRQGHAWVGGLIALMEPLGLSEGAVRTVLSRMARKGWLRAERVGRHSFYALTPKGRRLLEEGEARIHHPSWDEPWDGSWFLLAYSIPEDVRHLRDRLRDRLAWLGFGSLGNGLWISPHDVEARVRDLATQLGIESHLECFRATRLGSAPAGELVAKCWDLPAVNRDYLDFIERWTPRQERCAAELSAGRMSACRCYTMRFELIHEFRSFPLEDPFLPRALLPEGWAGERAHELFHSVHDLLFGPADAWVDSVFDDIPAAPALAASG